MPPYDMIRKRADFLRANRGKRYVTPGFILLAHPRGDGTGGVRLGITVTKKIGNAVTRNRMKRRFRALAAQALHENAAAGIDYILIGRQGGIDRDFASMLGDLQRGLKKLSEKHRQNSTSTAGAQP